jgi:hypothetical protein
MQEHQLSSTWIAAGQKQGVRGAYGVQLGSSSSEAVGARCDALMQQAGQQGWCKHGWEAPARLPPPSSAHVVWLIAPGRSVGGGGHHRGLGGVGGIQSDQAVAVEGAGAVGACDGRAAASAGGEEGIQGDWAVTFEGAGLARTCKRRQPAARAGGTRQVVSAGKQLGVAAGGRSKERRACVQWETPVQACEV